MSKLISALDFLEQPAQHPAAPLTVLFGSEWLLRQLALAAVRQTLFAGADTPCEARDGTTAEWRDVADELATVSLFAAHGPRLVVIHGADTSVRNSPSFISRFRSQLEGFADKPARTGVLVLIAESFPANTRLYKAVCDKHLAVDCGVPHKKIGRESVPDDKRIEKWLCQRSKAAHGATLMPSAAELLLELVGPDFGVLEQELAKLAACALETGKITPEMVHDFVAGWRMKTGWDMIDAALTGEAAAALAQLQRLLQAGESEVAICAQLSYQFRQLAAATRVFQHSERLGRPLRLREALSQAGVRDWPQGKLDRTEKQLRQLGRERGRRLFQWVLDADLALKGSHSTKERSRWVLEQIILRLSGPATARSS